MIVSTISGGYYSYKLYEPLLQGGFDMGYKLKLFIVVNHREQSPRIMMKQQLVSGTPPGNKFVYKIKLHLLFAW